MYTQCTHTGGRIGRTGSRPVPSGKEGRGGRGNRRERGKLRAVCGARARMCTREKRNGPSDRQAWPIRPQHEESVRLTLLRRFYGIENVPTKRAGNRVNKPNLPYGGTRSNRTILLLRDSFFPSLSLSLSLSLSSSCSFLFFRRLIFAEHHVRWTNTRSDTRQTGTSSSGNSPFAGNGSPETGNRRSFPAFLRHTVSRARHTSRRYGEQRNSARAKRDRQSGNNTARSAPFAPASRDTAENCNNWLDYRWDMVIGSARLPASPG